MDEKDKRADRATPGRDFDLTLPDIHPHNRSRPAPSDSDPTTINNALPQRENRPSRPGGGGGAPAPPQNNFDLTSFKVGVPYAEDEDEARQSMPPAAAARPFSSPAPIVGTTTAAAAAPRTGRRPPLWVWLVAGGLLALLLLIAGALALYLLTSDPAFTLRVLNAPPGSKIFIDDIPSGVPQRDGTIIVQGLRAGEPREVRVVGDGYAEWSTTVRGEGGAIHDLTVKMTPLRAKPTTLQSEIDYNGPMVLVAAGAFTMGDNDHAPDEKPAHKVELPAYYIDKYEVTNEQYERFCAAANHPRPINPFWDPQYFETNPRMPVIGINYADATSYAAWAGKRLPSESEWEKAASWNAETGEKRAWPWGTTPDQGRANLGTDHPTNVGQYGGGASSYGAHDMAGNAREWVDGFYQPYPGADVASNPKFSEGLRVARGGDFRATLEFARTTSRLAVSPLFKTNPEDTKAGRSSLIGFRCAVAADDPKLKAHLQQTDR